MDAEKAEAQRKKDLEQADTQRKRDLKQAADKAEAQRKKDLEQADAQRKRDLKQAAEKADAQRKKDQADAREQSRKGGSTVEVTNIEELEYKIKRLEQQATDQDLERKQKDEATQRYIESLAGDIEATTDFLAVGVSLSTLLFPFLPLTFL
jgi:hypothetical protein